MEYPVRCPCPTTRHTCVTMIARSVQAHLQKEQKTSMSLYMKPSHIYPVLSISTCEKSMSHLPQATSITESIMGTFMYRRHLYPVWRYDTPAQFESYPEAEPPHLYRMSVDPPGNPELLRISCICAGTLCTGRT